MFHAGFWVRLPSAKSMRRDPAAHHVPGTLSTVDGRSHVCRLAGTTSCEANDRTVER